MLSLFFNSCIVFLILIPTLWLLGTPISQLFSWAKTLKVTEKFFLGILTGLLVFSLFNYLAFFLNIKNEIQLSLLFLGIESDTQSTLIFTLYGIVVLLWMPFLINKKSIITKISLKNETVILWKDSEKRKDFQSSLLRLGYLFGVMFIYIFLTSIAMGSEGVLHQHTDNHFHSILVKLYMIKGRLSSTWKPIWNAPVIYPQGAHGIAGFVGILICKIQNTNPENLDVASLTMSFEIVSSSLTIASVYLLSSTLVKNDRITLLTPLALVFLGKTFITTPFLFTWVSWGGLAEITVICVLPYIIVIFLRSEKSFRSLELWLCGILFGAGLTIHTHLLFYFITAIGLYFPTIWFKRWYFEQKTEVTQRYEWLEVRKSILLVIVGVILIIPYYVWIFFNMPAGRLTNPYPSWRALLTVIQELIGFPFEITTYLALLAIWKVLKEKNEQMYLLVGWCIASISGGILHGTILWINDRSIPYIELIQPYRLMQLLFIPRAILASMGLVIVYNYIRQPDVHKNIPYIEMIHPYRLERIKFAPRAVLTSMGVISSYNMYREPEIRYNTEKVKSLRQNSMWSNKKRNVFRIITILLVINVGITVTGMVVFPRSVVEPEDIQAYDWLQENTAEDTYILNDDSGFWIPAITGRSIAFPNIAASDRPLVSQAIWDLYDHLCSLNASTGKIAGEKEHEMMLREGLDYIFITPQVTYLGTYSEYWVNIPDSIFCDERFFYQVYPDSSSIQHDSSTQVTQIYKILYNPAIVP
ncbi:MAG: DUF6541 family protein [Promethearchaeota archaeon]